MAKRMVKQCMPRYLPSGMVAKKLGVSPRTLGRITGNVWISVRMLAWGSSAPKLGLAHACHSCPPRTHAPTWPHLYPVSAGWRGAS